MNNKDDKTYKPFFPVQNKQYKDAKESPQRLT